MRRRKERKRYGCFRCGMQFTAKKAREQHMRRGCTGKLKG